jgi:hypothetical protein
MAWWDDAAEAVGSAVGWLGDAAEAVVDTATEVTEEVTESASDAADAGLDALRDGAASVGPALGAVANVVLGVVKGALHAVADLAATTFDVVRNVGKLLSDILHLNLADIIADLGNIGINILQLLVWGVRLVTGAYFGKEVSDYFMRDRALTSSATSSSMNSAIRTARTSCASLVQAVCISAFRLRRARASWPPTATPSLS